MSSKINVNLIPSFGLCLTNNKFTTNNYSHSKLLKVLERAPFLYIFVYVYVCLQIKTSRNALWRHFLLTHITISLDNKERPGDVLETKEMKKDTEYFSIFLFEVNNIVKFRILLLQCFLFYKVYMLCSPLSRIYQ